MTFRLLRERNGQITDVKFDADGRVIVRSRELVDPILDANRQRRNHGDHRRMGGDMHFVASIPNTIVHKWLQEGIDIYSGEQQDALARKLNDPDNAYLRTGGGHIGVSNGVAR